MLIFFIFQPSKISVSPISIVSSIFPPRCHLSYGRRRHIVTPCHTSFSLNQDELATSASSSGNASSCSLSSRVKIEALNLHHHSRPPTLDHPTPTLHCYKKIISTMATLPTTQPRLYFTSSLARAPHHQSSTHCYHSLSPMSHAHHPST
jgi:hypothetical protein